MPFLFKHMKTVKTPFLQLLTAVLYQIGIHLYGFVVLMTSPFYRKARLMHAGQQRTWDIISEKAKANQRYIWFHAASLGEFEQGRPVMERLKREQPNQLILLTFFSPSGYEVRKDWSGADIICYLPLDTRRNARRWLDSINISEAIFIKYDFWPNYLRGLQSRGIPLYSISSIFRRDQIFFKSGASWYRNLLLHFTRIFVQDEDSLQLLAEFGIANAVVAGDTRFDRVCELAKQAGSFPLIDAFCKGEEKILVAGSSWPADEALLEQLLKAMPHLKLILVPHEIGEDHLSGIERRFSRQAVRYTRADEAQAQQARCMVIDTIGMLSSIYRYADVAYIGGGFGAGIHNTLEAAVWKVPVLFGPRYQRFREACELIEKGGAASIKDYEELRQQVQTMLDSPDAGKRAGAYVQEHSGATDRIFQIIQPGQSTSAYGRIV